MGRAWYAHSYSQSLPSPNLEVSMSNVQERRKYREHPVIKEVNPRAHPPHLHPCRVVRAQPLRSNTFPDLRAVKRATSFHETCRPIYALFFELRATRDDEAEVPAGSVTREIAARIPIPRVQFRENRLKSYMFDVWRRDEGYQSRTALECVFTIKVLRVLGSTLEAESRTRWRSTFQQALDPEHGSRSFHLTLSQRLSSVGGFFFIHCVESVIARTKRHLLWYVRSRCLVTLRYGSCSRTERFVGAPNEVYNSRQLAMDNYPATISDDASDVVMVEAVDTSAAQHATLDLDMMDYEEEEARDVEMRDVHQEVEDVEMRGQDVTEDVDMVDMVDGDAVMRDTYEDTVEEVEDGHVCPESPSSILEYPPILTLRSSSLASRIQWRARSNHPSTV
ncbi:hypothetical protein SISNIDRAFT_490119 [Sistotremastrum niveocremeum HHB9708]|uniref:Uncharacterized protein n=2 Tax=Sistotremastraceae TaxID=3402574 RepID=A0A164PAH8_9AGAM|nr:hypothetical protein SISNIDRAFT_490119 [Sistotremastrum niveocremeum HHB9708]KZT33064.1 hypothetical protein SISSUDRAFT_1066444 [Sistotremastrum suecicum HHB10207 ss-3]